MKTRSLGLIFIAAVIVPSILLAVLSVRAAGREEAFVEKQLATPLDVETTHAAALANAEMARIVDELKAGIDIPAGGAYGRLLTQWKAGAPLVSVPFLLSPRYGILWPTAPTDPLERKFLQENADFLNDKAPTTVLQNIAERYTQEILAQSAVSTQKPAPEASAAASTALAEEAGPRNQSRAASGASGGAALVNTVPQSPDDEQAPAPVAQRAAQGQPAQPVQAQLDSSSRQKALDAFAQSAAIQTEVYQAANEKGDQLSSRIVQPLSKAASNAPAPVAANAAPAEQTAAAPAPAPAVSSPTDKDSAAPARKQAPAVVRAGTTVAVRGDVAAPQPDRFRG